VAQDVSSILSVPYEYPSLVSSEPPGPRPLFAAGQAQPPPGGPPGSGPVRGAVGQPVGKIVSSSANSRIVHPEDDVSLEELKAKKYKHLGSFQNIANVSGNISLAKYKSLLLLKTASLKLANI